LYGVLVFRTIGYMVPTVMKIIENPGKINFPGKSWKIDKNLKVMEN